MTIRTPGQLDRFLSRSLAWRKKELTALKFAVDTAPSPEQRVLLRAAATLLYAHWEGFVKEAGTCYLQLVSRQGLKLGELTSSFVAASLGQQIIQCGQTRKISVHKVLVDRLRSGLGGAANMPWRGIIRTRANLKADILEEIIRTLDLDYTPFELKAKPVINRLVQARNGIAHGEGVPVSAADYAALHSEIIALLDEFKNQLQSAAAARNYKL